MLKSHYSKVVWLVSITVQKCKWASAGAISALKLTLARE